MSQWDKLLDKVRRLSPDLRFEELKKVYIEMVREVVEREEAANANN